MPIKAVSIKNLAFINHNGNHYRVNFAFISKIKNVVIIEKKRNIINALYLKAKIK